VINVPNISLTPEVKALPSPEIGAAIQFVAAVNGRHWLDDPKAILAAVFSAVFAWLNWSGNRHVSLFSCPAPRFSAFLGNCNSIE